MGVIIRTEMFKLFKYLDERLGYYLRRKYRDLWGHKGRSLRRLNQIAQQNPAFAGPLAEVWPGHGWIMGAV